MHVLNWLTVVYTVYIDTRPQFVHCIVTCNLFYGCILLNCFKYTCTRCVCWKRTNDHIIHMPGSSRIWMKCGKYNVLQPCSLQFANIYFRTNRMFRAVLVCPINQRGNQTTCNSVLQGRLYGDFKSSPMQTPSYIFFTSINEVGRMLCIHPCLPATLRKAWRAFSQSILLSRVFLSVCVSLFALCVCNFSPIKIKLLELIRPLYERHTNRPTVKVTKKNENYFLSNHIWTGSRTTSCFASRDVYEK